MLAHLVRFCQGHDGNSVNSPVAPPTAPEHELQVMLDCENGEQVIFAVEVSERGGGDFEITYARAIRCKLVHIWRKPSEREADILAEMFWAIWEAKDGPHETIVEQVREALG